MNPWTSRIPAPSSATAFRITRSFRDGSVIPVVSTDPRTGSSVEVDAEESSAADVDRVCRNAETAGPELEALGRQLAGAPEQREPVHQRLARSHPVP
jgi:hypothetical protein